MQYVLCVSEWVSEWVSMHVAWLRINCANWRASSARMQVSDLGHVHAYYKMPRQPEVIDNKLFHGDTPTIIEQLTERKLFCLCTFVSVRLNSWHDLECCKKRYVSTHIVPAFYDINLYPYTQTVILIYIVHNTCSTQQIGESTQ